MNFSDDGFGRVNLDTFDKYFTIMALTPTSERIHRIGATCENGKHVIQLELAPQSSAVLVCEENDL